MPGFDNNVVYAENLDFSTNATVTGQMTTDGQLLIGSSAAPHIRVSTLSVGPGLSITNGNGSILLDANRDTFNQQQIIYVGKHGNDANSGLNIDRAKLTFGAAITAASAIGPAVVVCFDDGTYTENLTGVSSVNIFAPNCVLTGNHSLAGGNSWTLGLANVSTGTGFTCSSGGTECKINCKSLICDTNANGIAITAGYLDLEVLEASVFNGNFLNSSTTNEVYVTAKRCTILGTGSFINCTAASNIFAFTSIVTGTGTAISCTSVAAHITLLSSEINITNLSNIAILPDVRITAAAMMGALNQIGAGVVDAIDSASKIENVPIGASQPNTGHFTNLSTTSTTNTDGVCYFDGSTIVTTTVGTAGQVLTSNGAAVAPTFQAPHSLAYFQAYLTASQTIAAGSNTSTVIFDTAISNFGSAYDTSTGIFTAPATGFYAFSTTLFVTLAVGTTQIIISYKGSVQSLRLAQLTIQDVCASCSWFMPMTVGDTVSIISFEDGTGNYLVYGSALSPNVLTPSSTFSGFRIA